MHDTLEHTDVLIVGGGVIGLALAFELGARGVEVAVVERSEPGSGAARVAAGMLAPTSEAMVEDPRLVPFALDSLARYPRFVERVEAASGISCAYRDEGTLWVALHGDHRRELEHLRAFQEQKGLDSEWLDTAQLREREPLISERAVAAMYVPSDHQVDPRRLCTALAGAIAVGGGTVVSGAAVRRVESRSNGLVVHATKADRAWAVRAEKVVVCAGAWSTIDIDLPLPDLRVRPVRGQTVRLRGTPLIDHVVHSPDVYLVPRPDGELIVGGTVEEKGFDEPAPTVEAVRRLLRDAWELLPGIDELAIAETAVSYRPAVRDNLPVLSTTDRENLFVAGAHYRSGVLLAPASAFYMAELIASGRVPEALAPFMIERMKREKS